MFQSRPRKFKYGEKKSRKRFYLLLLLIVSTLFFFYFNESSSVLNKNIIPTPTLIPTPTKTPTDANLEQIVKNNLINIDGDISVVIVNLKTGQSFYKNENVMFDSASLYKLWVMEAIYRKVANGSLKLSDKLTDDISHLNKIFNIASKSAERKEGEISLTVKDALEKMIIISDNYSSLLLVKNVGISQIQDFLNQYGFSNSKVGINGKNPQTSAYDTFLFYSYLYNNKFPLSNDMVALLKRQALNEKLPKLLPQFTPFAHKTGELGAFSHDAGIVYGIASDYIIVVMSRSDDIAKTNDVMSNLSKEVYEYFKNDHLN